MAERTVYPKKPPTPAAIAAEQRRQEARDAKAIARSLAAIAKQIAKQNERTEP